LIKVLYFEYDDFNDIDVKADLVFEKTTFLELFEISGIVNVNCDLPMSLMTKMLRGNSN
jgi:hypothetical protein